GEPDGVGDGRHGGHGPAGGVDPQGDAGAGILSGEREQLRREQRSVVVIEHAVEHEYPLQQQLLPLALGEGRGFLVVSHASTLRHGRPQLPPTLPWADLPTAARSDGPAAARRIRCRGGAVRAASRAWLPDSLVNSSLLS